MLYKLKDKPNDKLKDKPNDKSNDKTNDTTLELDCFLTHVVSCIVVLYALDSVQMAVSPRWNRGWEHDVQNHNSKEPRCGQQCDGSRCDIHNCTVRFLASTNQEWHALKHEYSDWCIFMSCYERTYYYDYDVNLRRGKIQRSLYKSLFRVQNYFILLESVDVFEDLYSCFQDHILTVSRDIETLIKCLDQNILRLNKCLNRVQKGKKNDSATVSSLSFKQCTEKKFKYEQLCLKSWTWKACVRTPFPSFHEFQNRQS